MDAKKVKIAVIVLIILVVLFYFYQTRSSKGKLFAKKGAKEAVSKDTTMQKAKELYNIAHERFCKDMDKNEFKALTREDDSMFIELKQLYNLVGQANLDMNQITIKDYAKIIESENK